MTIYLKHVEGSQAGRTDAFDGGRIRIGRQPDNDLCADPTNEREVSGYHAEISQRGHTFILRDLQSRNGTYLNARRIEGDVPLNDGDTIQFSQHGPKVIFSTWNPSGASETLPPGHAMSAPHEGASDWRGATGIRPNLLSRVKNILLRPHEEWPVIAGEATSTQALYMGYIGPLAIIGPIASVIGMSLIGFSLPFVGTYRMPLVDAFAGAVVSFVLTLVAVFVLSLIIDALAPSFGGVKDRLQALKVAAYSATPAWVVGIVLLIPMLSLLSLLGLYALYLLYLGLPVLMRSPREKALGYTAVVVVCAIVLWVVIGVVARAFLVFPTARLGLGGAGGPAAPWAGGAPRPVDACAPEIRADAQMAFEMPQKGTQLVTHINRTLAVRKRVTTIRLDVIGTPGDRVRLEGLKTLAQRLAGRV